MTTPSPDNLARDDRGRWCRSLSVAERDAEAARLRSKGWAWSKIAAELGYTDGGNAHRGARRAMADLAQSHGAEELRRQQVESNLMLRERLWQIVDNPGPLVDRLGRPVHDDDGRPVYDAQAVITAAGMILKAEERLARLTGLDAPKRSVRLTIDQGFEQVRAAYMEARGFDPLSAETSEALRRWREEDEPLRLGTLAAPRLSDMEPGVRDELLAQIREIEDAGRLGFALQHQRPALAGQVIGPDDDSE